ncbi:MAG TPA: thiamine pyrophosphate-dependent dehydrogenase E1 component subunit alpha [Kouleothrix sp.]|uniref:thiamine pyrophosphate-dependent dehydrogenase E1 component subunit alpha n=1 Tax=Kouleothrix sp. TaxID=2779161 RepID=UPI002D0F9AC4|nr:thiamine pyrophosphate-dependent dehydrogenase E1 component subunit alpha [Kouleothrix sp.]HRC74829.1 thiamine pyrophosphate-dependent dehydrogenase E1 component subunit alpha [Kouleothrix sp.]
MDIGKDTLLWAYERMRLIREFEERLHLDFAAGKIPGFVHLYAGEEAVATGLCAHLRDSDFLTSTHRGHGHCIAKGVDVRSMMAEIYGKATGSCKGKGGSMHIADVDKGMLGANGIVGGGPPMACGAGLTAKIHATDQVTVCFFGDGASNQGTTFEGLNLAGVWKLPVVFVCENNGYAETTSPKYSVSGQDIAARARGFGMPSVAIDGLDFFAVYEAAREAVARARRGDGPTFIEAQTYRYYGHFEGDTVKYRDKEEEAHYRSLDCIGRFRATVVDQELLSQAELDAIDQRAKDAIVDAVRFADESPFPAAPELLSDVYVNIPERELWPFQTAGA